MAFNFIDFYRYLNRKLDEPLKDYRFDDDLPENYRNIWAKKVLPNHFVGFLEKNVDNFFSLV